MAYAPKNPEVEYRKLVEQYTQNGELKKVAILVLTEKRKILEITDAVAEEIEREVLEPFRRRLVNLQSYKQYFAEEVEQQYPLNEQTLKILKDYRQDVLGLRNEDVASTELEITSVKETKKTATSTRTTSNYKITIAGRNRSIARSTRTTSS